MNNCAGGTTPWGTVLSGEENFNQYFLATGTDPRETRYGLSGTQDARNWRSVDPRWDATDPDYANEPNRFGWIVEIDPHDPRSTPVKHTAMGRFKHEGANVIVNRDGHVVAYMGDDERFDYVYRFVSRDTYRRGTSARDRKHNLSLLSSGDLSVARFTGDGLEDGVSDGTGEWIPLTRNGESVVPGFSTEEVLVFTRLAADAVQPTKMDRPEDVQPSLHNGRIYVACTNNTDRGKPDKEGPTEPNPRPANKDGHVVEIAPTRGDHTATTFSWNLILICGDPATAGTYFGGYTGPVSPISCPDNVAFDSVGTSGSPPTGSRAPWRTATGSTRCRSRVPSAGGCSSSSPSRPAPRPAGPSSTTARGRCSWPCSTRARTGPGTLRSRASPTSSRPAVRRAGEFAGPRPTVVQVTRR